MNGFSCVTESPDGIVYAAGFFDTIPDGKTVNVLTRIVKIEGATGKIVRVRYYDYSNGLSYLTQRPVSIEALDDGGLLVAISQESGVGKPLFYVKYDSLGCDTSALYCATVGLPEEDLLPFSLGPNPADKELTLEFRNGSILEGRSFRLINSVGQKVRIDPIHLSSSKCIIPTTGLPSGIYLLGVRGYSRSFTRVVIQH